jgi:glycosyltransferase involved in cell wall biosynthesis
MNREATKPKVLLIQPVLAHYRRSFLESLLGIPDVEFHILAGEGKVPVKAFSPEKNTGFSLFRNHSISLKGHRFFWQNGLISEVLKQKPDAVILPGIDFHYPGTLILAVLIRIMLPAKLLWWGHATIEKQGWIGTKLRNFFFGLGDGIFTYNQGGADSILKQFPSKPVIPLFNSLNKEDYGFNESIEPRKEGEAIRILFSGRFTNNKRVDILIEAMDILRRRKQPFTCRFVGDGPALKDAENQVKDLGISDSVEFLGEVYGNAAAAHFKQSDLFVLPGKVGLSIVHALSFGLPVITTNQKHVHSPEYELIEPGQNGDFFEGFNPESLADCITIWNEKINSKGEEIRETCKESVIRGAYLPEKMAERMSGLVRKILTT